MLRVNLSREAENLDFGVRLLSFFSRPVCEIIPFFNVIG